MKIYIDENFPIQLANGLHILEKPNNENVEVISIREEFGKGAKDEDWIPKVGRNCGIVITQDYNIHRTQHLYQLLKENGCRIFFFKPPSKKNRIYVLGDGRIHDKKVERSKGTFKKIHGTLCL